jgi:hypothetical protein
MRTFHDPALAELAAVADALDARMQMAPPQQVGRPQPQTTKEQQGGPFIRYTQEGNLPQYISSGNAFGALVQQPLVARPGYYRDFRLWFNGSGGSGSTTVTAAADAPYNVASLIQFKDPFGTLIFSLPSYEAYLVHLFSGGAGCGLSTAALPANLPSFQAVVLGANASGNFSWALTLPLEFAKGIGTAPGANAALQPTLQVQLNTSALFYGVAPTVPPTISVDVESDFYWLPEGADIAPPALGTSRQWILQQANPVITTGGNQRVAFPRLGGYLDTLIVEIRDSTNARNNGFPGFSGGTLSIPAATNRFVLYIDGVPINDSPMWKALDDQFIEFRGNAAITGVYVYTRKTSLNQQSEGLLDTGEAAISSNPGTLFELQGQPWGTFANGPAIVNVIVGQIVPRGRFVQGLPEV